MPLQKGDNPKTIGKNIEEMQAHGHPHEQAVAAALHTAKDDQGEYGRAMSRFHRANDIHKVASQDAVLNWGGGQNAETVLPGGEGDTPTMPSGAAAGTGVDAKNPDNIKLREMEKPSVLGYELHRDTLTPKRETINFNKPGDYGADPLGSGQFKMVPSGDVVSLEERNRRLKK